MAAPGWFTNVFHKFVIDLQDKSMRGESTDLTEASVELWTRITGHSERQLARALEEVLGGKEIPVSLQGGMIHRVHVDRIAKYLVNRGTILDEEPDLFPAPLDQSSREGSYVVGERQYERPRRGRLVGGPSFEEQETQRRMRDDDQRIRRTESGKRVGFVDEDGRVR
jgi:hypothetical protein